ncbi:MAG: DUF4382 domain-containing protein [Nitrososphaerota archaeon]|nr:DUF4382 domain-containing protein [Nitrososphaerota archaeon]MDG6919231.1 DUF4382 domain-containing protein [Nitrososphaerota archaeon]MDG6946764.1 DUF4382 domain-containing protein [Nitrososphaerota archaeon]MDG6948172.1 DUF4382 domain-containing protein [Nitrososphaerota archaeon]
MNKIVAVSALVLLATLGFSAYAYTIYFPSVSNTSQAGPGSGSLNIYLSDPPPSSPNLSYLLVNVTSVTIKYSANVTAATTSESSSSSSSSEASSTNATSISTSTTSFASSSTVSISSTAPPSSVNRYVYNVPASVGDNVNLTKLQGSSILLGATMVPSGNVTGIVLQITGAKAFWTDGTSTQLKVVADGKLFVNVHFTIQSGGSADLTFNLSPGDIHISPGKASVLTPVIHVTEVSTGARGTQTVETTVSESESSSSTT